MIRVQALTKTFGPLKAVNGLSFDAPNGQVTGLIGHNGAGKTTTFRILAGLMEPDDGVASIDDFNVVTKRRQAQSRLGILPDVRGLYPRLTAREHLEYFGELHGLDGRVIAGRSQGLIERLGMVDFADRRCRGFSRGQELKVALARALIHEPSNLILDEPTNGLDVASSRAVHDLIRERRDRGAAVVISSHIMAEVAALCDHLVIIAEGHVVMSGAPDELHRRTGQKSLDDILVHSMVHGDQTEEAA